MKGDNDYPSSEHEYIYTDLQRSLSWFKYFEFMGILKYVYSVVTLELQFCFIPDIFIYNVFIRFYLIYQLTIIYIYVMFKS